MIESLFKKSFIVLISAYKSCISVFLIDSCRFNPTCSSYAIESIKKHRVFYAIFLIIKRVISCHPFNKNSGYDPVP